MYFKIQNLTKDFGNIKAVKKFSLEVSEGELVSLLSPSGCKKRPVSTVFQNYTLSKKSLIDKANKMLDIVEMLEFKNRSARELSGGQQQRIALVRSLVLGPNGLLMDEPLSNLDTNLRLKMRKEIKYKRAKYNGQIVEKKYLGFFTSYNIKSTILGMKYSIFADFIGTNKNFDVNDEIYFKFKFIHTLKYSSATQILFYFRTH